MAARAPHNGTPAYQQLWPSIEALAESKIVMREGEKRERELQQLVRRGRKPVALFVDEAHDLHGKTLVGLKRLMEVVADGGGMLSVVLVGHPKLRNDLRRPTLEEVGYRSAIFEFDGMAGHQLPYIRWLLEKCAAEDDFFEHEFD